MTSRDFCFWLQGYFEIHGDRPFKEPEGQYDLNDSQAQMIRKHLALVFKHEIDPSMGNQEHQGKLNEIHNTTFADSIRDDDGEVVYRC